MNELEKKRLYARGFVGIRPDAGRIDLVEAYLGINEQHTWRKELLEQEFTPSDGLLWTMVQQRKEFNQINKTMSPEKWKEYNEELDKNLDRYYALCRESARLDFEYEKLQEQINNSPMKKQLTRIGIIISTFILTYLGLAFIRLDFNLTTLDYVGRACYLGLSLGWSVCAIGIYEIKTKKQ